MNNYWPKARLSLRLNNKILSKILFCIFIIFNISSSSHCMSKRVYGIRNKLSGIGGSIKNKAKSAATRLFDCLLHRITKEFEFDLNLSKDLEMPQHPIVYSPEYNFQFQHHFIPNKYQKVSDYLRKKFGISFYQPKIALLEDLKLVHTEDYLNSLNNHQTLNKIFEIPIEYCFINPLLQKFQYVVGGTILATYLAMKHGWAINIGGGLHHAKPDQGEGFCIYNDIAIAIKKILKENSLLKVLIVDLDAHMGNGNATIFFNNPNVTIFDMFNNDLSYPQDKRLLCKPRENFYYIPLSNETSERTYLCILKEKLPPVLNSINPNLIIYNAGTDILSGDQLGKLNVSINGIIERDEFLFTQARTRDIPIAMVLSGGYSPDSVTSIQRSIENLINKFEKF